VGWSSVPQEWRSLRSITSAHAQGQPSLAAGKERVQGSVPACGRHHGREMNLQRGSSNAIEILVPYSPSASICAQPVNPVRNL